jgi:2-oxoglutarate dehydrogenase E2 component (dihydrolipoamide succinyltransferase)
MGESIAEGTIVRWIKKVGDSVDRDEPLFEISTDKVDAEIPSPAAGTLIDIAVKEGETVPVNSVVATIGAAGEKSATSAQSAPSENVSARAALAPAAGAQSPAPSGKNAPHTSQVRPPRAARHRTAPTDVRSHHLSCAASRKSTMSISGRSRGRESRGA